MSIALSPLMPGWLLAMPLLLIGAAVAYGAWRRARGIWWRAVPLLALWAAIADPRLVREERAALDDVAVIAVDDSASQQLGERRARTEQAVTELTKQLATEPNLEVRVLRLGAAAGTQGGNGTRLFGPLANAIGDVPQRRLAGVVVVSDGQVHDVPSHEVYAGAQSPVHLLLTGDKTERDRRIRIERAPDFAIVGDKPLMRITVDTVGGEPARVPVTVRRNGQPVQQLEFAGGETADLPIGVDAPGANVFEVDVAGDAGELSPLNNRALVSVSGVRDRLRVLLISGEPHVGERAWRNFLKSDPNVDLVHFTILRPLTKDDGTPLNELALIAFPIRELFEEQLYEFDLIIFDRYSRKGLVPYQFMGNVAAYVRDGGAVMLAVGPEYADSYSLFDSPLQGILPAAPTGVVHPDAYKPTLSEIGKRHPVTADLSGAVGRGGEPTWGRWLRHVQVAATSGQKVMDGVGGEPLLLLDRVGKGRVALLLSDTMWLWGKGVDGGGPQADFLRRVAHWLMKEPQLEEESLAAEVRGENLVISRRSLAPSERPITIARPDGEEVTVSPRETGAGRATIAVPAREPGLYRLRDTQSSAVAAVGAPNPLETFDIIATPERLKPLVEATDGGIYWLSEGGTPAVRRTAPGRVAHGSTWLGLKANNEYVVTGVRETTLLPFLLTLLLAVGGAMAAWWREGR
jgi:hypothetical protein